MDDPVRSSLLPRYAEGADEEAGEFFSPPGPPSVSRLAYGGRRTPSPRLPELHPRGGGGGNGPASPATTAASDAAPSPVLCAFRFAPDGVASPVPAAGAAAALLAPAAGGWAWVHLRREAPGADAWLRLAAPGLGPDAIDELLSDDDAPRCSELGPTTLLLRLRGLHRHTVPPRGALAPQALEQCNHLYAINLVIQPDKVLSAAAVSLEAVRHARELLRSSSSSSSSAAAATQFATQFAPPPPQQPAAAAGPGGCAPRYPSPGDFVSQLVEWLFDDAASVVAALQDDLDALEEAAEEDGEGGGGGGLEGGGGGGGGGAAPAGGGAFAPAAAGALPAARAAALLAAHRRTAVKLRRWVGPHRTALRALLAAAAPPPQAQAAAAAAVPGIGWLLAGSSPAAAARLAGCEAATSALLEALEASREQALVLKDELQQRGQLRANHALYLLSVVSALFLPFSFVTGLLSMSIGGIPGHEDPRAFRLVAAACVLLMAALVVLFRRLRWL